MIPRKNEIISLMNLNIRDQSWVVKGEVSAHIEDVEVISNGQVRLTALVHGRPYYCVRPFSPSTLDELRASVWKSSTLRRINGDSHQLLVEAVSAFNVHRDLGMKSREFVCDSAVRTTVVPHVHNAYCAKHDRVHYWGERCARCASAPAPTVMEMQMT